MKKRYVDSFEDIPRARDGDAIQSPEASPQVDFSGLPEKAIPYVDPRVLSHNHPGLPLYLLMSAPQFVYKRQANNKQ